MNVSYAASSLLLYSLLEGKQQLLQIKQQQYYVISGRRSAREQKKARGRCDPSRGRALFHGQARKAALL
ncbi:hypothetical protein TYRP_018117 [Tyrophagus putrescentiae]|nr:hypothetical protein TYRP_018117 [Tyrophagus putrescentiae]